MLKPLVGRGLDLTGEELCRFDRRSGESCECDSEVTCTGSREGNGCNGWLERSVVVSVGGGSVDLPLSSDGQSIWGGEGLWTGTWTVEASTPGGEGERDNRSSTV